VAYGQDWLLLLMPAAARHGGDVRLCSACAAEEQLPQHHVQAICLGMYPVSYNDLTELARLCLRQANTARTPAVANELRRMAEEYQARAAALMGGQLPDIGERAPLPSTSEAPSNAVQQQQQPQDGSDSADAQSSPTAPKRP
jgi:hypothetical protein